MFWGWGIPETRNPPVPLHWKGEDHDILDREFVDLLRNYKIPDIGSCKG